jgi:hypothetical protein
LQIHCARSESAGSVDRMSPAPPGLPPAPLVWGVKGGFYCGVGLPPSPALRGASAYSKARKSRNLIHRAQGGPHRFATSLHLRLCSRLSRQEQQPCAAWAAKLAKEGRSAQPLRGGPCRDVWLGRGPLEPAWPVLLIGPMPTPPPCLPVPGRRSNDRSCTRIGGVNLAGLGSVHLACAGERTKSDLGNAALPRARGGARVAPKSKTT